MKACQFGKNQERNEYYWLARSYSSSTVCYICLCERGYSALAQIKTKTGNCLEPENDTRLALSKIVPNFDKVVESIQNQRSR